MGDDVDALKAAVASIEDIRDEVATVAGWGREFNTAMAEIDRLVGGSALKVDVDIIAALNEAGKAAQSAIAFLSSALASATYLRDAAIAAEAAREAEAAAEAAREVEVQWGGDAADAWPASTTDGW